MAIKDKAIIITGASNNKVHRQEQIETEEAIGLDPKQIARAISFAIDTPPEVDVNEIIVRPLGQPM